MDRSQDTIGRSFQNVTPRYDDTPPIFHAVNKISDMTLETHVLSHRYFVSDQMDYDKNSLCNQGHEQYIQIWSEIVLGHTIENIYWLGEKIIDLTLFQRDISRQYKVMRCKACYQFTFEFDLFLSKLNILRFVLRKWKFLFPAHFFTSVSGMVSVHFFGKVKFFYGI